MVDPVEVDARGLVAPDVGLQHFRLERLAPSPAVARLVDRYWVVTWDLRGRPPHTQHVFAHPVVNVTFQDGGPGLVTGVSTSVASRTLAGRGRVLGVMFRAAGFRPLLGRSLSSITDTAVALADVVGAGADGLAATIAAAPDAAAMAAAADDGLAALLPPDPHPAEATTAVVERIAADRSVRRVDGLAAELGCSVRHLQRRFADHVGVSPKAVIRRYRLYEAAERARSGPVDWSRVAADLGYSDQAHLTRDFTAAFGLPPGRYLQANRA